MEIIVERDRDLLSELVAEVDHRELNDAGIEVAVSQLVEDAFDLIFDDGQLSLNVATEVDDNSDAVVAFERVLIETVTLSVDWNAETRVRSLNWTRARPSRLCQDCRQKGEAL